MITARLFKSSDIMGKSRTYADGMLVVRLQKRFVELCWKWIATNQATKTALGKEVGLEVPRIVELMKFSKKLTMYYVRLFHKRGIFRVDEIYDGQAESDAERELWDIMKITEDTELLKALSNAMKGSVGRDALISILKNLSNGKNQ